MIRTRLSDTVCAHAATLGNIKHDLFEQAMLNSVQSVQEVYKLIPNVIEKRAQDCYASDMYPIKNYLDKICCLLIAKMFF